MSRTDFARLIAEEATKFEALHAEIERTVASRDRSAQSRLECERACEAFHSYVSPLNSYLERACDEDRYSDKNLVEFVVCFLEVDPWVLPLGLSKADSVDAPKPL